jgi:hypothetical protein
MLRRVFRRVVGFPGVLVVLAIVAGCANPAAERKQLSSPDPLSRARAAVSLAEAGDATAVHKLVDLLEDRDRAVRMYAILGLKRLTGNDYGYRYYESEAQRAVSVDRWRQALQRGEVVVGSFGSTRLDGAGTVADRPAAEPLERTGSNGVDLP